MNYPVSAGPPNNVCKAGAIVLPEVTRRRKVPRRTPERVVGPNAISTGCEDHSRFLAELLKTVPGLTVNGDQASRHPGNLNLLFPSIDASLLLQNLHPNVAASTGSACTSGQPEPSHVLRAIGLSWADANASIRFGIGRFTTQDDVDLAVAVVAKAWKAILP